MVEMETETERHIQQQREKFKVKLREWLKFFRELLPPQEFQDRKSKDRIPASLGSVPGRLEVGARQYFVSRAVKKLSKEFFEGAEQPPLKPGGYPNEDLEKHHACTWCGAMVQAVQEDPCATKHEFGKCAHGKAGCKDRCPFCALPWDMWVHDEGEQARVYRKGTDILATTLLQDHTCNCGACIEIPKLSIEGKDASVLREHHTCDCNACIANMNALLDTKTIAALRQDHTCNCNACIENQRNLATS